MRLLRSLIIGVLLVGVACALAAEYVIRNQNHLVQLVLARIKDSTGLNIVVSRTRVSFGHHLVVVLENPRVLIDQRELMRLGSIRAIIAYHSLVQSNGLPLYSLILDNPDVRVPATAGGGGATEVPRLGAQAAKRIESALEALESVTGRFEINGGALDEEDNVRLADHLDVTAYQQHRRPGKWPWLLKFNAFWRLAPLSGTRLAGDFWVGGKINENHDELSSGHLWFSGIHLKDLEIAGVKVDAGTKGDLHLTLTTEGELDGDSDLTVGGLVLHGSALTTPVVLGDARLHTDYRATPDEVHLTHLSIEHSGQRVLEGGVSVGNPYEPTRTLAVQASGVRFSLLQAAAWLRAKRGVSAATNEFATRFTAGDVALTQAALEPSVPLEEWTIATIRDNLKVAALLKGCSFLPPDALKLQRVSHLEAAISYSDAVLEVTQGTAKIGNSSLTDATIHASFKDAPKHLRYTAKLKASLDIGELYPAVVSAVGNPQPAAIRKIETVGGVAPGEFSANGDLNHMSWRLPKHYSARVDLSGIEARVKAVPSAIAVKSGTATLQATTVQIKNVAIAFVGPATGDAVLNGTMDLKPGFPTLRKFSVALHSLPAAQWLPLAFDPDSLSANGPIGGRLQIDTDAAHNSVVTGKLTMAPGQLQLGFLRSPIITKAATLTLDGKGMEVSMPASQLEGAPLQIKFTVADFSHPALRIDAAAEKLDFEVMRFIRLPWSKATPPHFFSVPVIGHITARSANFDKLPMTDVAADFSHDSVDWKLMNCTAKAFDGHMDMDIDGRARDDWIHMRGIIAGMNAKPLTSLMESDDRSPLTGEFFARFDLWGNTDVNFFDTLAGTMAIEVRDGKLNRFLLLTRILGLIDLKSWITAQFPNPLVAGIPFNSLTGDFKGRDGDFYTENMKLDGPLMSISADGDVKLGNGTINMRVGLVPFTTVNWIISKIPLMGEHLANGSSNLLAAYFQVRGPVSNPTVIPKPITSVANFVIQTLKLPINILKPTKAQP
jgi:AsmA-like C-terminal region